MAATLRSSAAVGSIVRAPAPRARSVVVCAQKGDVQHVQLAAAALLSAAALVSAGPVEAGVIITQPQLKKVFIDESVPETREQRKMRAAAAPSGSSFSAPSVSLPQIKPPSFQSSEGGLDPRAVALPGAIGAIGALAFAAKKIDPEIGEWFDTAMVKNSGNDGVGYEPAIKPDSGVINLKASGTQVKKAVKKTVKKVAKAAPKGGSGFSLPNPFNKD